MKQYYEIVKTYLNDVKFVSPHTPEVFMGQYPMLDLDINMWVNVKRDQTETMFLVSLSLDLKPRDGDKVFFNLQMVYSALLKIKGDDVSEEVIDRIVKLEVPQYLYGFMRAMVWNITNESGFTPVMLKDYDFANMTTDVEGDVPMEDGAQLPPFGSKEEAELIREELNLFKEEDVPMNYKWVLRVMEVVDAYTHILEVFKKALDSDLATYEELPMYKYFHRFFAPMKYAHPDFPECEEGFWTILFQLLFAEGNRVSLVQRGDGLPDLEYEDEDGELKVVSQLSLAELKSLTMELTLHSFLGTGVKIMGMQQNESFGETLLDGELVSLDDLMRLFCCGVEDDDEEEDDDVLSEEEVEEDIEYVESLHQRIVNCDVQTFPYRFFR